MVTRRKFLKLSLLAGLFTGCASAGATLPTEEATPNPNAVTAPPGTTFALAEGAVTYGAYEAGCNAYAVQGLVRTAEGTGLAGVPLRISTEGANLETTVRTEDDGSFLIEVAGDPNQPNTYFLQVLTNALDDTASEVVVLETIPDCALNLMQVTFIAQ